MAEEGESEVVERPSQRLKHYDADSEFKRREKEERNRKLEEDLKKYNEEHEASDVRTLHTVKIIIIFLEWNEAASV